MLADDDRNDIRIEAALVKLYASEMAWQIADELIQIRGGRGYETADVAGRPRRARRSPVEQILRDLRINRIFEGSTEIMHLLIAREAVDQHLSVAGDIIDPEADLGAQGQGRRCGPAASTPGGCRPWRSAAGRSRRVRRVRPAGQAPALRRAGRPASWPGRPSTAWPAGRASWSTSRASSAGSSTSAPSCSRCRPSCVRAQAERPTAPRASSWPTCSAARPGCGWRRCSTALWHNTDAADVAAAKKVLAGPLHRRSRRACCRRRPRASGCDWEPGPSTEPDVRRRIPAQPSSPRSRPVILESIGVVRSRDHDPTSCARSTARVSGSEPEAMRSSSAASA